MTECSSAFPGTLGSGILGREFAERKGVGTITGTGGAGTPHYRRRHGRLVATAVVVTLTLSDCGTPRAAEPADAPALLVAPVGRVVAVGAQAEGIVADPVTHLVAVGVRNPGGIALLDGRTGRMVDRLRLPGHLRHLSLAAPGGPVLVPDESSGALLTIVLPAGKVATRTSVGSYPHDAAAGVDGIVAVADEHGGTLVLVRAGVVVGRIGGAVQPDGVAATGTMVGLVDVRSAWLDLYDLSGGAARARRVGQVGAGDGPSHVVADRRGRLLVADTRGNRILVFATAPTLRRSAQISLPATPYGLAYDQSLDRLWVTLTALNARLEGERSVQSRGQPVGCALRGGPWRRQRGRRGRSTRTPRRPAGPCRSQGAGRRGCRSFGRSRVGRAARRASPRR